MTAYLEKKRVTGNDKISMLEIVLQFLKKNPSIRHEYLHVPMSEQQSKVPFDQSLDMMISQYSCPVQNDPISRKSDRLLPLVSVLCMLYWVMLIRIIGASINHPISCV